MRMNKQQYKSAIDTYLVRFILHPSHHHAATAYIITDGQVHITDERHLPGSHDTPGFPWWSPIQVLKQPNIILRACMQT